MKGKCQSRRGAFRGKKEKKEYFEGWYLKQQKGEDMISFIPAYHIDRNGRSTASIQVITREQSWMVTFDGSQFYGDDKKFYCQIGKNVFSQRGVRLHLQTEGLTLHGKLEFGEFTPLNWDIMGPFRLLPFLQCNHGILSLSHQVTGSLTINGKKIDFNGGTGYIEKDWGTSFPETYVWTQCSLFDTGHINFTAAVARIPFGKQAFQGCISVIYYGKKQYRLATYLGARVVLCSSKSVLIRQGKDMLYIRFIDQGGLPLKSPARGSMSGCIQESLAAGVRYQFWRKGRILLDVTSDQASLEIV